MIGIRTSAEDVAVQSAEGGRVGEGKEERGGSATMAREFLKRHWRPAQIRFELQHKATDMRPFCRRMRTEKDQFW
jgi:hypothetical protein